MSMLTGITTNILLAVDPWDILAKSNNIKEIAGLDIGGLVFVLRCFGILVCFLGIGYTILKMIWNQKNPKAMTEGKSNIEHKLTTIFLIVWIIFLFNLMKEFFDSGFGL